MIKVYASKNRKRAIMVDSEDGIIKSYGLVNVLCCEAYGEDGLIETEELEETKSMNFAWDESCKVVYMVQDKEAGNVIDIFATKEDAVQALEDYEEEDMCNKEYTPDFYEIVAVGLENLQVIKDKYGLNVKQISEKFDIPYKTVQNWNSGQRECPRYIIKMMDEILKGER